MTKLTLFAVKLLLLLLLLDGVVAVNKQNEFEVEPEAR